MPTIKLPVPALGSFSVNRDLMWDAVLQLGKTTDSPGLLYSTDAEVLDMMTSGSLGTYSWPASGTNG